MTIVNLQNEKAKEMNVERKKLKKSWTKFIWMMYQSWRIKGIWETVKEQMEGPALLLEKCVNEDFANGVRYIPFIVQSSQKVSVPMRAELAKEFEDDMRAIHIKWLEKANEYEKRRLLEVI